MPFNLTAPRGAFPQSSFKYTPLEHIRTLFVGFVQGLFGGAPLGAYHWTPADDTTEIYIADEAPINTVTVGFRPAVSFTRGPMQFYSLGLDDMYQYHFDTSAKEKAILVPGTMSINCSSRVDIEVDNIAWVISEHLWLLRELLLSQGFFEIGRQLTLLAPTKGSEIVVGDGSDEWFTTTIICPLQFSRTSRFTPLGREVANNINLALQAVSRSVNPKDVITYTGSELPIEIITTQPPAFDPDASDAWGNTPNPAASGPPSLPLVPHPLNPAKLVRVRVVRGSRAVQTPPPGIPISSPAVEESTVHATDVQNYKV